MTTRLTGALVAGALAVGMLVGAAGTVLVHDATRPSMGTGDMGQMHRTMTMMGDGIEMPMRGVDSAEHQRHHPGADG
jgi:hypothetical protein